jgi:hypothetical protein
MLRITAVGALASFRTLERMERASQGVKKRSRRQAPRRKLPRTIIAQADGRPLGGASLGNEFRDWLRKRPRFPRNCHCTGCARPPQRRLAEAGSTVREIAAVTGHKTLSEVARYTKEAEKTRLAASGMAKVVEMFKKEK